MSQATVTLLPDERLGTISPLLHGQFAEHIGRCCVDGIWVGRDSAIPNEDGFRTDVKRALAELGLEVLRWPGGCFADTYHWRDGIGPPETRPRTLGESCGLRVVEDNGLGTHEFVRYCREVGAEPYLAGNVGTGTPREMMEWAEYCNSDLDTTLVRERASNGDPEPMGVRYWGVGNENWGCGGNFDPEDYAREYRRFATGLKMADPNAELVACGHCEQDWNRKVVEGLRSHWNLVDHFSVHRYYSAGSATGFSEAEHYQLMRAGDLIENDIRRTHELLEFFGAGRKRVRIAFDEWGVWHPEARGHANYEQPCTIRDAVAAAGVLDAFHRWNHALCMANIAQVVNVLQCLIQTREDRTWLTPTYLLFELYKPHRGATAIRAEVECGAFEAPKLSGFGETGVAAVSCTASVLGSALHVSASNRAFSEPREIDIQVRGGARFHSGRLLAGASPAVHNSFEVPYEVTLSDLLDLSDSSDGFRLTLPPCSVATLRFQGA